VSSAEPRFLTLDDVLRLHTWQLEQYGGSAGVRDQGLLEAAIAQPQAGFGGEYLHADIWEMAAAYLFHIVQNHPFIDGNKRAGLYSALVFLDVNRHSPIGWSNAEMFALTVRVASGELHKPGVADAFRRLGVLERPPQVPLLCR